MTKKHPAVIAGVALTCFVQVSLCSTLWSPIALFSLFIMETGKSMMIHFGENTFVNNNNE